ncbi:MAG: hypothetical protein FRX49_02642 [Trebouxia sp. A1-2]|nr:MAG: hypothetical protein FRX49_02642 [Trebouxia sp. A1-2]
MATKGVVAMHNDWPDADGLPERRDASTIKRQQQLLFPSKGFHTGCNALVLAAVAKRTSLLEIAYTCLLTQLANHPIKTTAQAVDLTSLFILKACAYDVTVTILPQGMHCYSGSPQGLERERAILMQALDILPITVTVNDKAVKEAVITQLAQEMSLYLHQHYPKFDVAEDSMKQALASSLIITQQKVISNPPTFVKITKKYQRRASTPALSNNSSLTNSVSGVAGRAGSPEVSSSNQSGGSASGSAGSLGVQDFMNPDILKTAKLWRFQKLSKGLVQHYTQVTPSVTATKAQLIKSLMDVAVGLQTAANPSNCQRNHIKAESQNKLGTMAVSAAGLCGFVRLELRTPSTRVGSALICLTLSAIVVDPWFHSDQASGIELMLPLDVQASHIEAKHKQISKCSSCIKLGRNSVFSLVSCMHQSHNIIS